MNVSRVAICFVTELFFATFVSGQQGSIATQTTPSSPTENISAMPASKPTAKVDPSSFSVLVFNFRQVSTDILSNAEKEADQIFGRAGIKIVWHECPTGNEPCRKGPGPVFFLAIKAGPVQNKFLDVVSGEAMVAEHLAVVNYDALPRVAHRKTTTQNEASTLLACVIAHELGHLLLGAHGHSLHGVMRDRWDVEQTRLALMSELDFLPEEGRLMRSALLDGTEPGEAAHPALISNH
jgi:hypothetical protein